MLIDYYKWIDDLDFVSFAALEYCFKQLSIWPKSRDDCIFYLILRGKL